MPDFPLRPTALVGAELRDSVRHAVADQPVWDLHTHLYSPAFGTPTPGGASTGSPPPPADPRGLLLWGIDELLTYHYLVAEVFRVVPPHRLPYRVFWRMTKAEQADHIWRELFVERTPLSEACRGVLTTLGALGLDPSERDLNSHRRWFAEQVLDDHVDNVMRLAGVTRVTMTNDVFDDNERMRWLASPGMGRDTRFAGVLRFDPLLIDWPGAAERLTKWGFPAAREPDAASLESVRRFLCDWLDRIGAVYAAASLPPAFRYHAPDDGRPSSRVLADAVLPVLAERGLPLALMVGVQRGVNPALGPAGDSLAASDVGSLTRLARDFPANRLLVTLLAREDQHALAVAARKFGNLTPFGCWWFLNNPSLIEEITRMRVELLGPSFIPQHSDARVLEQLLYKWRHSREVIARVLTSTYEGLAATGWAVSGSAIRRDAGWLLQGHTAALLSTGDGAPQPGGDR